MAGLDGRIEIGIDYRPCIVHVREVLKTRHHVDRGFCKAYQEIAEPEERR